MLLLSVSTKKRKHNWEITKRDLTKLTSPSVRTKNDWSRRASAQKIGYLNSRTLRSVRLFFFSPSPGVLSRSHPRGIPCPHSSNAHSARKARKKPSHDFSKPFPTMRTCMRRLAHLHRCNSCLCFAAILPQLRRRTSLRAVPAPIGAPQMDSNCPSAGTRKNATLTTGESVA